MYLMSLSSTEMPSNDEMHWKDSARGQASLKLTLFLLTIFKHTLLDLYSSVQSVAPSEQQATEKEQAPLFDCPFALPLTISN